MTRLATAEVVLDGDITGFNAAMASAASRLEQVGRSMQRIGAEMTLKVTTPILGIGTAAVRMAADFDASMRKIVAYTATSEQTVNSWRTTVREMGVQYGISGKDAADALYFVASAGLTGSKAIETLRAVLKGTTTGLGDSATLAHAATAAMNAYAKSGMTATRALEILAGGIKSSNFSVEELAPDLGRVTGLAAALNIPLENVVGTLAVFGHVGTSAAESITQLSSLFSVLLGHNVEGVKALAQHGLSLANLRKEAAGPGGLISVMRTLNGTFGANLNAMRDVIPNIRAFRGVISALAQDGTFVDKIMHDTADSVGLLDQAFAKSQGPAFKMKQAVADMKNSLISLGNTLMPIVVPALQLLASLVHDVVDWFTKLDPDTRRVVTGFVAFAAAAGPILLVLGPIVRLLSAIPFAATIAGFLRLSVTWGGLMAAMRGSTAFFSIQAAFGAASLAGTGFRGVIIGLIPWLKNLWVAALPSVLMTGGLALIGLIVAKWIQMKMAVIETAAAIKETKDEQDRMFADTKPEQAAKEILQYNEKIKQLGEQIAAQPKMLPGKPIQLGYDIATKKWDTVPGAPVENTHIAELEATRDRLIHIRNELQNIVGWGNSAADAIKKITPEPDQNVWAQAASKALMKLKGDLEAVQVEAKLVGPSFNAAEKQTAAYEETIKALTQEGVPMNAALNAQGLTLNDLVKRMADARARGEQFKDTQKSINTVLENAQQIVKDSRGEVATFDVGIRDLTYAFLQGKIGLFDYMNGLNYLKNNLDQGKNWLADARNAVEQSIPQAQRYQETLDNLARAMAAGTIKSEDFARAQAYIHAMMDEGNASLQNAHQILEASRTPLDKYNEGMRDLNTALATKKMLPEEYARAVKYLQDSFDGARLSATKLKEYFVNELDGAINMFVDGVTSGKFAFSDFVRSALNDLAKLILKLEIMHALFPQGTAGASFLDSLFGTAKKVVTGGDSGVPMPDEFLADGGYLAPGKFAVVGERGPEFLQAGSQGMTVTPMKTAMESIARAVRGFAQGGYMAAGEIGIAGERGPELVMAGQRGMSISPLAVPAGQRHGDNVTINVPVSVSAIDAQGVSEFFDNNEGLVAGAVMKAYQKSSTLRRRLGG